MSTELFAGQITKDFNMKLSTLRLDKIRTSVPGIESSPCQPYCFNIQKINDSNRYNYMYETFQGSLCQLKLYSRQMIKNINMNFHLFFLKEYSNQTYICLCFNDSGCCLILTNGHRVLPNAVVLLIMASGQ